MQTAQINKADVYVENKTEFGKQRKELKNS